MPIDPKNEAIKQALKEGIREWLDDQFKELGKWTFRGLAAGALAGIVWLMLVSSGWVHK
jgi:hypothetical protein